MIERWIRESLWLRNIVVKGFTLQQWSAYYYTRTSNRAWLRKQRALLHCMHVYNALRKQVAFLE